MAQLSSGKKIARAPNSSASGFAGKTTVTAGLPREFRCREDRELPIVVRERFLRRRLPRRLACGINRRSDLSPHDAGHELQRPEFGRIGFLVGHPTDLDRGPSVRLPRIVNRHDRPARRGPRNLRVSRLGAAQVGWRPGLLWLRGNGRLLRGGRLLAPAGFFAAALSAPGRDSRRFPAEQSLPTNSPWPE